MTELGWYLCSSVPVRFVTFVVCIIFRSQLRVYDAWLMPPKSKCWETDLKSAIYRTELWLWCHSKSAIGRGYGRFEG